MVNSSAPATVTLAGGGVELVGVCSEVVEAVGEAGSASLGEAVEAVLEAACSSSPPQPWIEMNPLSAKSTQSNRKLAMRAIGAVGIYM
jgi:hypothetical protein